MAPFLEDPRLRQRWNQISHNAEAVTENAAAGIWTFQHTYITPCLASLGESFEVCTSVCFGDREERARRQRERTRGARRTTRAEYSFDFYDDWYDDFDADDEGGPADGADDDWTSGFGSLFGRGFWGSWRGNRAENWDRLLAGSGASRVSRRGGEDSGGAGESDDLANTGGEVVDQPRPRRTMTYTTRAVHRKVTDIHDDPTVIPSTAPLGFLRRLPFKIGGTLRYKPSSANLREHPGASGMNHGRGRMASHAEREPLLRGAGSDDDDDDGHDYRNHRHNKVIGSGSVQTSHGVANESREFAASDDDQQLQYGSTNGAALKKAGAGLHTEAVSNTATRKRSSTTGSGETSDSFRSRGDLFPSDEEDDEDAVPLDDEFAVALDRVGDDHSSGRTRFSSSSSLAAIGASSSGGDGSGGGGGGGRRKGKRRADSTMTASQHSSQTSLKKELGVRERPLVGALAEVDVKAEAAGDVAAADADASYDADTSVDADAFDLHAEDRADQTDLAGNVSPAPEPEPELPPSRDEPPDSMETLVAAIEGRQSPPARKASQGAEFVPAMLPRFR